MGRFSGHSPPDRHGARDLVASGAGVAALQSLPCKSPDAGLPPQCPRYYARAELAAKGAVARFHGED